MMPNILSVVLRARLVAHGPNALRRILWEPLVTGRGKWLNLFQGTPLFIVEGMSNRLKGKVALVAGGSRGCGRGIALALGDQAATVYVTGRSIRGGRPPVDGAHGTIEETAEEVTRRGGLGIPVQTDHTDARQTSGVFDRVQAEQGRLDVLACAVWGGNERFIDPTWKQPFWELPVEFWDDFMSAGPRAFWIAAQQATRLMAGRRTGLIVAISEPMINPDQLSGNLQWDLFEHLPHYALNRLVMTLAPDARRVGVTLLGLLPGFMRTERVQMHMQDETLQKLYRYDLAESTEYTGRAVAALAADPNLIENSGRLIFVGDAAKAYGFTDIDGRFIENFYRVTGRL
jgi:NAD(P)-dependent dehydrogenase (short-subunit alcohol dehydrogenase family)